ncbi:hypothetical protein [Burkholderia gladioli]|uniref:DNA polymerase III subunit beta family protein n=1 Tax=Burkholderia gladioli TaxID=28095 RepID=UPI0016415972|nr:hypothetical protein [Burkholderia gladioli]
MQRIFLTGTQLKAVHLSAAIKDVRHFLNGVHLEATRNETRLVATDGSMMVAFRAAAANELEQSIITLTVPNEVVKQVRPAKGASDVLTIEIEGWRYTMVFGQLRIGFEPVAGAFPDYRRIVATKASGVVGHYDPDRLAVMKRIGNMLGRSRGGDALRSPQRRGRRRRYPWMRSYVRRCFEVRPESGADVGAETLAGSLERGCQRHPGAARG